MKFDKLFWLWITVLILAAYVIEARLDELGITP